MHIVAKKPPISFIISVRPSVGSQRTDFHELNNGDFYEKPGEKCQIRFKNRNPIIRSLYVPCIAVGEITSPFEHCCATLCISILLTMKCCCTVHTERIVVSPLQQWLRERATLLRYTYMAYLFLCYRLTQRLRCYSEA